MRLALLPATIFISVCAISISPASAQFTKPGQQLPSNGRVLLPAAQFPAQRMSPEQVQKMMWLRALQSRGRRGVQTGVPQAVPFGPQDDFGAQQQQQTPSGPRFNSTQPDAGSAADGGKKTSAQKRAEARQAREEEKRVAREDAKKGKGKKGADKKGADKKGPEKKAAGKKADKKAAGKQAAE